jgi:hypothetical protein
MYGNKKLSIIESRKVEGISRFLTFFGYIIRVPFLFPISREAFRIRIRVGTGSFVYLVSDSDSGRRKCPTKNSEEFSFMGAYNNVLHGGIFLVIKPLDLNPDPDLTKSLDPDPDLMKNGTKDTA